MKNNNNGKHSFLFWLIVPFIMAWLSIAYITGIILDKPLWYREQNTPQDAAQVVPYFKDHGSFSQNLDQPFVTFWFDDAWLSQYLQAYPVLKSNNFSGTIAVPVNAVETANYMNWAQLVVLQNDGWEITNHSLSHDCTMQNWDRGKIAYEYKTSKLILWKNGLASDIFVTPCGVNSNSMRQEAQKVFMGYRTVDPGFNDPKNFDFYNIKVKNIDDKVTVEDVKSWIDQAKASKAWVILVFHKIGEVSGIEKEDEFNTKTQDFERMVNYVKASNIKVVVPQQIMASQN